MTNPDTQTDMSEDEPPIKVKESLEVRRARKAERRAKQRLANVGRAEKMHRARVADLTAHVVSPDALPNVTVACSGWFYWGWKGQFYPSQMPTRDWFSYYSDHFSSVELNAPFYSWPTVNTVRNWLKQAEGKSFVYTVKASELITHVRQFEDVKGLIEDFGYIADLLGERMGCFLFQLPPSFHYSPERLERIVSQLDPRRRNVVELRHPSWWTEEVYAAFRAHGIIFCSCSGPKLPDDLIVTSDDIYVRFHGTEKWYLHDYSNAELTVWADKIRNSGAARVWGYFNNDYQGFAIKNAQTLARMLGAHFGGPI
jgi:uncharacterized protein YecE (DUF72 family)